MLKVVRLGERKRDWNRRRETFGVVHFYLLVSFTVHAYSFFFYNLRVHQREHYDYLGLHCSILLFQKKPIIIFISFITTTLCPKTTLIVPINKSPVYQRKVHSMCVPWNTILQETFTEQEKKGVIGGCLFVCFL